MIHILVVKTFESNSEINSKILLECMNNVFFISSHTQIFKNKSIVLKQEAKHTQSCFPFRTWKSLLHAQKNA